MFGVSARVTSVYVSGVRCLASVSCYVLGVRC